MNSTEIFMIELGWKSVALMAAVSAVMCLWRRGAAATRHFLWFAFLGGLLLLPLGSRFGPAWHAPGWAAARLTPQWIRASRVNENAPPAGLVGQIRRIQPAVAGAKGGPAPAPRRLGAASPRIAWQRWLVVGWMAGVAVALGRLFLRWAMLRGIERASRVSDSSMAQSLARTVQRELGLRRGVRLLESARGLMPMTWGWWRPVVLLPSNVSSWDEDRVRMVLRHEMAHVQRWDCLTQGLGNLVSALYWFNPLVWHGQRQMQLERERACDDVVLGLDTRASDYAGHLLAVAGQFGGAPRVAALPMARRSNLEERVRALLDFQRKRGRLHPMAACGLGVVAAAAALIVGGCEARAPAPAGSTFQQKLVRLTPEMQRQGQIKVLKSFAVAKEKQSAELAAQAGERITPEFQRFFDAATNGDAQAVMAMFESFRHRHHQYDNGTNAPDASLTTAYWGPVLELCLAYTTVAKCEPKYTGIFQNDIIHSIPAGSIYFGGTDPGRGLPTAFCKSQAEGDPFFTLTQNALADATYLQYLRTMYGKSIYTPTEADSQKCFAEYLDDAERRLKENQLKPGENVKMENGHVQVSGQVAVMSINGLLTKIIFDKNPGRDFYVEESFPLEWMYPYLEPHGLIFRIRREPMAGLAEEAMAKDHEYWSRLANGMIGPWLEGGTPLKSVTDFVEKIYGRKDLEGFKGDPRFVENDFASRSFSKLRSSIGGLYAWRVGCKEMPTPEQYRLPEGDERQRVAAEADFAFRQAFALCPDSPEVVYGYAYFLAKQDRGAEALMLAETAERVRKSRGGEGWKFEDLIAKLRARTWIDWDEKRLRGVTPPVSR